MIGGVDLDYRWIGFSNLPRYCFSNQSYEQSELLAIMEGKGRDRQRSVRKVWLLDWQTLCQQAFERNTFMPVSKEPSPLSSPPHARHTSQLLLSLFPFLSPCFGLAFLPISSLLYSMRGGGKVNIKLVTEQCQRRHKRQLFRHRSQGEMFIDMSNLWKSSTRQEERLFTAIKQSDLFSEDRLDTFVKFNYRTMENKNMNYHTVFQKTLAQRNKLKKDRGSIRGTMNVSQLWSERHLQDILGSLPYPKDRLKVLHSYEKNKALRIRTLRNRQIQEQAYRL